MRHRIISYILRQKQASQKTKSVLAEQIDSLNTSCTTARSGWFFWLGISAYILVTLAGVTHTDLLLDSPIKLPLIAIEVPLSEFFVAAPLLYGVIYIGILVQHEVLSRKVWSVESLIRENENKESGETKSHRVLLSSYFFSQAISGPGRNHLSGWVTRAMVWLTLGIMPILILLWLQIKFLPFHRGSLTFFHQVVVLSAAVSAWFFMDSMLRLKQTRFRQSLIFLALFSFVVATVPDSRLDNLMKNFVAIRLPVGSNDREWTEGGKRTAFILTALLFEGSIDERLQRPTSLFSRNLVLTNATFGMKDRLREQAWLNLRNRNLNYAIFDRSHFNKVDFTGASLNYASFREAELNDIKFECISQFSRPLYLDDLFPVLKKAKETTEEPSFIYDPSQIYCTELRGNNFARARLNKVSLPGAALINDNFIEARFVNSEMTGAMAIGDRFDGAQFITSDLSNADFAGSTFVRALFISTSMKGTSLKLADLKFAKIMNSDMDSARVYGADLRGAQIWGGKPPGMDYLAPRQFGGHENCANGCFGEETIRKRH